MDRFAQRLDPGQERVHLVLPAGLSETLARVVSLAQRPDLAAEWGFPHRRRSARGVSVLFVGPPGTGKTLAARFLAQELGIDLYRVDLARIVSKYIGETEKNLGRLFDEAGATGAVLLFEEADALFGARTEVHDSHDRYANMEVSYLLQRLENFEGIAIVTARCADRLDHAFLRRFSFVLRFPTPDERSRLQLWRLHVPAGAHANEAELARVASDFALNGKQIRDAVLAAVAEAGSHGRPVTGADLTLAAERGRSTATPARPGGVRLDPAD